MHNSLLLGTYQITCNDKAGALRLFLEIEKKLKDTNEPYYKGLLYSQIGEVYYAQMNYNRAYHYFRESRNNFRQSENLREETEATLDMAAATYHSRMLRKQYDSTPPHLIWLMSKKVINWPNRV